MENLYDQPFPRGATSNVGLSGIEARLARIETHLYHEAQYRKQAAKHLQDDFDWIARELDEEKKSRHELEREMDELKADRVAFIIRVGMWVIGGLLSALSAIVFTVWQSGIPGHG